MLGARELQQQFLEHCAGPVEQPVIPVSVPASMLEQAEMRSCHSLVLALNRLTCAEYFGVHSEKVARGHEHR